MMASHIVKARRYRTMQEAIDRIEELEAELGMPAHKAPPFGLTRKEFEIASVIGKSGGATYNRIISVVWGGDSDKDPKNILGTLMVKIRRKLTPHGIKIQVVWGSSYAMDPESLYRWRVALGGGQG